MSEPITPSGVISKNPTSASSSRRSSISDGRTPTITTANTTSATPYRSALIGHATSVLTPSGLDSRKLLSPMEAEDELLTFKPFEVTITSLEQLDELITMPCPVISGSFVPLAYEDFYPEGFLPKLQQRHPLLNCRILSNALVKNPARCYAEQRWNELAWTVIDKHELLLVALLLNLKVKGLLNRLVQEEAVLVGKNYFEDQRVKTRCTENNGKSPLIIHTERTNQLQRELDEAREYLATHTYTHRLYSQNLVHRIQCVKAKRQSRRRKNSIEWNTTNRKKQEGQAGRQAPHRILSREGASHKRSCSSDSVPSDSNRQNLNRSVTICEPSPRKHSDEEEFLGFESDDEIYALSSSQSNAGTPVSNAVRSKQKSAGRQLVPDPVRNEAKEDVPVRLTQVSCYRVKEKSGKSKGYAESVLSNWFSINTTDAEDFQVADDGSESGNTPTKVQPMMRKGQPAGASLSSSFRSIEASGHNTAKSSVCAEKTSRDTEKYRQHRSEAVKKTISKQRQSQSGNSDKPPDRSSVAPVTGLRMKDSNEARIKSNQVRSSSIGSNSQDRTRVAGESTRLEKRANSPAVGTSILLRRTASSMDVSTNCASSGNIEYKVTSAAAHQRSDPRIVAKQRNGGAISRIIAESSSASINKKQIENEAHQQKYAVKAATKFKESGSRKLKDERNRALMMQNLEMEEPLDPCFLIPSATFEKESLASSKNVKNPYHNAGKHRETSVSAMSRDAASSGQLRESGDVENWVASQALQSSDRSQFKYRIFKSRKRQGLTPPSDIRQSKPGPSSKRVRSEQTVDQDERDEYEYLDSDTAEETVAGYDLESSACQRDQDDETDRCSDTTEEMSGDMTPGSNGGEINKDGELCDSDDNGSGDTEETEDNSDAWRRRGMIGVLGRGERSPTSDSDADCQDAVNGEGVSSRARAIAPVSRSPKERPDSRESSPEYLPPSQSQGPEPDVNSDESRQEDDSEGNNGLSAPDCGNVSCAPLDDASESKEDDDLSGHEGKSCDPEDYFDPNLYNEDNSNDFGGHSTIRGPINSQENRSTIGRECYPKDPSHVLSDVNENPVLRVFGDKKCQSKGQQIDLLKNYSTTTARKVSIDSFREYQMDEIKRVCTMQTEKDFTVRYTSLGRSVFATKTYSRGDRLLTYNGNLISAKEGYEVDKKMQRSNNSRCFLFFFEFKGERLCLDASLENNTLGRLINHGIRTANVKPTVNEYNGMPYIIFTATKEIKSGDQLFYDYNDRRRDIVNYFTWLTK